MSIDAVGDILLDRGVARAIQTRGIDYPFSSPVGKFGKADLSFGNLECPLGTHGPRALKQFSFQARPETARALVDAGLDIFSLANNHTMDRGREGLVETMDTLRRNRLAWCGAGVNLAAAEAPSLFRKNGLRIAVVGFCQFLPERTFLRDDQPTLSFLDLASVRRAVAAARRRADLVIVSVHWGIEYADLPTELQRQAAHAAINAGADLVIGHHPHVLQGLEVVPRHNKSPALIAYSLGSFVFDPRFPQAADSAILHVVLSLEGVQRAWLTPVVIQNCRPVPASPAQSARILGRVVRLCTLLNTRIKGSEIKFAL